MPEKTTDAAARKTRPGRLTPPDTGRLAHRHLGAPAAAGDLKRLVRLVADWAAVERLKLPPSRRKQKLDAASAAAADLAAKMRAVGPGPLLGDAAARAPHVVPTVPSPGAERLLATPLLDRARATQDAIDAIKALAAVYAAASDSLPSGKQGGAPSPQSLVFGLTTLLEIWRRHRPGVPPDQGRSAGRFGALARDLFGGPPCGFEVGEVDYAVEKLLPRGAPARQVAPIPDPVAREAPGIASVRIIGTTSALAKAVEAAFAAGGAKVRRDPWSMAASKAGPDSDCDLLIMVPDDQAVLAPQDIRQAPPMSQDAIMRRLVLDPLRELDRLELAVKPRRVAILMPAVPDAPQCAVQAWAPLYAARAALATLVQMRARAPGWERSAVVAMQIGWGARTEHAGLPLIPSSNDEIAATMLASLAQLGTERGGAALDLYGSKLPVLMAWPERDISRRAAPDDAPA